MNPPVSAHFLRCWLPVLGLTFALPLGAQTAPATSTPDRSKDDEVFVLSPFTVNTSSDTGYQASSSLGGIGINTKLTDIGSTIAVITSQFLDDTASTNLRDLLLYQTSAESTGFGGNLSGAAAAPGGPVGEPSLSNSNSGTRLRGLAEATQARNYFRSIIPMDGYNTDRVEINRGANALLLGVGSPAGIINTGTTSANLSKQSGRVEFALGSFESRRASFSFNLVPAKGELAFVVAAVNDKQKYQQKFAYSDSRRQYAALAWDPKPLRDRGIFSATTLRASFEMGHIQSNRPRALTPGDRFSSWFDATLPQDLKALGAQPKVIYDPTGLNNGSTSSFNVFTAANRQATIGVIDNVNRAPVFFFQDVNATAPRDNIQGSALAGGQAVFGRPMVVDNYRFPAETRVINGVSTAIPARTGIGVAAYAREMSRVRSDFGVRDGSFYTSEQMWDTSTFDYFNNTLIGPNSEGISNLQARDISLQQLMLNRKLGFELSYNRQSWDESLQSMLPSGAPYISIDVNTRMWTGEVNPNFGRAFVSTPGSASFAKRELDTQRAKLFYELNLQEKLRGRLGWVLGKHVFAGLKQREVTDSDERGGGQFFYTPDRWAPGSGQSRGSNTGKRVSTWIYLGTPGTSFFTAPSLAGANLQGLQQNLMNFNNQVNGKGVMLTRERAATAADALLPAYAPYVTPINLLRENREVTNTAGFANLSRSTLDSEAASLQSNWLGDHLVSTVGVRREKNTAFTTQAPFEGTGESYVLVNDPRYKLDYRAPTLPALVAQIYEDQLFSWSTVAKTPQKWLLRLPALSAFNVYYGYSENFQPSNAKLVSAFGDEIRPPSGNTKEMGVYIEALEGKISARVNFFRTTQQNVINNSVANIPAAIMQIDSRAFDMVRSGALPPGGAPGTPQALYPANYILPPKALLDTFKYSITQSANGFLRNATDPGVRDTSDYETEGMELEIMLKATRGLSFTFNLAKVESIGSNTGAYARKLLFDTPTSTGAPLAVEWLKAWAANTAIALGSVGNEGTSDQFILNNNFQSTVLNPFNTAVLSDGSPATELRKWRANLATRYVVQEGKLKGGEFGGAVRWQNKSAIGFPVATFEADRDANGKITLSPDDGKAEASDVRGYDVKHPFYGPTETRFDLWAAYQTKIMRGKIGLRFQLNVRNVGIHDQLIPIRINPNGKEAAWSIAESQRYTFTTRFSF
jgi:outer membrane receptor protein involved in Fe transport